MQRITQDSDTESKNFSNDRDLFIFLLIVFMFCVKFSRCNIDLFKEYPVCEQASHFASMIEDLHL